MSDLFEQFKLLMEERDRWREEALRLRADAVARDAAADDGKVFGVEKENMRYGVAETTLNPVAYYRHPRQALAGVAEELGRKIVGSRLASVLHAANSDSLLIRAVCSVPDTALVLSEERLSRWIR